MDRARLEKQLRLDEGVRFVVYLDTRGMATVGVGHKVLEADKLTLGQRVTGAQIAVWLQQDMDAALAGCVRLFPQWEVFPESVQEVLANMVFQLGAYGVRRFTKMHAALARQDYAQAAHEMRESLWFRQTPQRASRLVRRMQEAGEMLA